MLSALLACYTHRKKSVDSDCTATMRMNAEHSARVVLPLPMKLMLGYLFPARRKTQSARSVRAAPSRRRRLRETCSQGPASQQTAPDWASRRKRKNTSPTRLRLSAAVFAFDCPKHAARLKQTVWRLRRSVAYKLRFLTILWGRRARVRAEKELDCR